jgi:TolB-like protein
LDLKEEDMFKRALMILTFFSIMSFLASPLLAQEEEAAEGQGAVEQKIEELADKIVSAFEEVEAKEEVNRIAVVRLTNLGPTASEKKMGQIVAELLTTSLARRPQFQLVEREQIEKVLDELKLSLLGLAEAENAEKVGKLLNARAIITGSISEVGEFFSINARQVDVETGKVILAVNVDLHQSAMLGLPEKYLVRRTKSEAMFRSFIPGWGQFYNEQPVKGYLFSGVELGLIGTSIAFYFLGDSANDKYDDATTESDATKYDELRRDRFKTGDILLYTAIGIWALNIADAYLNGPDVEEVKVASRDREQILGGNKQEGISIFTWEGEDKKQEIGLAYNFRF